jgi:polyferredoxin
LEQTIQPLLNHQKKGLAASLFVVLLFTAFASFIAFGTGSFSNLKQSIISGVVLMYLTFIMFMILYSGNVNKWRKLFFTTYAVVFAISFVWWTMGDRGHMWLLDREILYSQAPMCHIVVPMLLLPMLFKSEIIFPTSWAAGGSMLLMVVVFAAVYGRAFCSWGCFYGGQDELFSSLKKKKSWKIKTLHPFIRYFPYAMLLFIVLFSFATLTPAYCNWFCPFKGTTEFMEVNSFIRVIQTFMFVGLWMGLAIALPLLTKKRTQCGLFCPMGAFLGLTHKINLFKLKIDKTKCNECKRCITECPTFSMTEESLAKGKPLMSCTKCGACMNVCKPGAISFGIKGVPYTAPDHPMLEGKTKVGFFRKFASDVWEPSVLFLFGIFSLGTVLAFSFFVNTISRMLNHFLGV